jgi:hypothetical protein
VSISVKSLRLCQRVVETQLPAGDMLDPSHPLHEEESEV